MQLMRPFLCLLQILYLRNYSRSRPVHIVRISSANSAQLELNGQLKMPGFWSCESQPNGLALASQRLCDWCCPLRIALRLEGFIP